MYGRGRGRGGGSGPSPALLTANVKNSKSIEELFRHVHSHVKLFNHIHLSACWSTIGTMAASSPTWYVEHAQVLESLVQHTQSVVSTSPDVRARELANIAHGVAKSGRGGAMGGLFAALAAALGSRWEECNAQELANAAWAFAKAEQGTSEVYAALARAARDQRRLASFKEQELASLVWAFATMASSTLDCAADGELLRALAATVERRLAGFSVQGLSKVSWGFARLGHHDPALFRAVATVTKTPESGTIKAFLVLVIAQPRASHTLLGSSATNGCRRRRPCLWQSSAPRGGAARPARRRACCSSQHAAAAAASGARRARGRASHVRATSTGQQVGQQARRCKRDGCARERCRGAGISVARARRARWQAIKYCLYQNGALGRTAHAGWPRKREPSSNARAHPGRARCDPPQTSPNAAPSSCTWPGSWDATHPTM